jgi:hypothetical protein
MKLSLAIFFMLAVLSSAVAEDIRAEIVKLPPVRRVRLSLEKVVIDKQVKGLTAYLSKDDQKFLAGTVVFNTNLKTESFFIDVSNLVSTQKWKLNEDFTIILIPILKPSAQGDITIKLESARVEFIKDPLPIR